MHLHLKWTFSNIRFPEAKALKLAVVSKLMQGFKCLFEFNERGMKKNPIPQQKLEAFSPLMWKSSGNPICNHKQRYFLGKKLHSCLPEWKHNICLQPHTLHQCKYTTIRIWQSQQTYLYTGLFFLNYSV